MSRNNISMVCSAKHQSSGDDRDGHIQNMKNGKMSVALWLEEKTVSDIYNSRRDIKTACRQIWKIRDEIWKKKKPGCGSIRIMAYQR